MVVPILPLFMSSNAIGPGNVVVGCSPIFRHALIKDEIPSDEPEIPGSGGLAFEKTIPFPKISHDLEGRIVEFKQIYRPHASLTDVL
jgi:hypothetical protein